MNSDTRCQQCREQDESCLFGEGESCPYRMTTEEEIAFLEGHEDETWELARRIAHVISYEISPERNALRMWRLIEPLIRDKGRLDWLEANGRAVVQTTRDGPSESTTIHGWIVEGELLNNDRSTLRDSIDAARKAKK